jgi:chemotaxis protein histidine kinase CheA
VSASGMFNDDAEVLEMFAREAADRLDEIEAGLVKLKKTAGTPDPELVGTVFRAAHSLKAAANLLGFTAIDQLTHKAENILQKIRTGALAPEPDMVTALLGAVDTLRELAQNPAAPPRPELPAQLASLETLAGGGDG